jgi:hypothetical protein
MASEKLRASVGDALRSRMTVHENLDQELLMITSDRLELIVNDFAQRVKESMDARYLWYGPAGIFATILVALVTTTCTNALGISSATWKGVFMTCAIVSLCATVYHAAKAYRYRQEPDAKELIDAVKRTGQSSTLSSSGSGARSSQPKHNP